MSRLSLVTPPETLAVTLDEVRLHSRIDHKEEDDLLESLIRAATGRVERWLGRSLIDQTWDYYVDSFPGGAIVLPRPPLLEIISFVSPVEDGEDVTGYEVDQASVPARIFMPGSAAWPTVIEGTNAAKIRFRSGYLQEASPTGYLPEEIKIGLLHYVADLYENRENFIVGTIAAELPFTSKTLMHPYRVERGMA